MEIITVIIVSLLAWFAHAIGKLFITIVFLIAGFTLVNEVCLTMGIRLVSIERQLA